MIHLKELISSVEDVYISICCFSSFPLYFAFPLLTPHFLHSFLIRVLFLSFPADALVIRLGRKQRPVPSVGAGRSCQSLQRFLMIAFQMTL